MYLWNQSFTLLSFAVSTFRPFNLLYVLLFGWWQALIYIIAGFLMFITIIGKDYGMWYFVMLYFVVKHQLLLANIE